MKRVATELPIKMKEVSNDTVYDVSVSDEEGSILVTDGTITVKVSLTSPLLREQGKCFFTFFYFVKKKIKKYKPEIYSFLSFLRNKSKLLFEVPVSFLRKN